MLTVEHAYAWYRKSTHNGSGKGPIISLKNGKTINNGGSSDSSSNNDSSNNNNSENTNKKRKRTK